MSTIRKRPRRLEYMGAMAAGLAHEVKNPLSTMSVNLQLLAEDCADPKTPAEERALRRARLLLGEVRRLDGIVKDFLELARGYEFTPQSVDLEMLVLDLVRLHDAESTRLGVQVTTRFDPRARHVVADPKFLRTALGNLVVNAQQALAGEEGTARRGPGGGHIDIETRATDGMAQIRVTDDGPGIPRDRLEKIFMPFWSSKASGTGLGLAVTRRIVEELGGEVKVTSEPGRGTRFTVTVPRTPAALPGGPPRSDP